VREIPSDHVGSRFPDDVAEVSQSVPFENSHFNGNSHDGLEWVFNGLVAFVLSVLFPNSVAERVPEKRVFGKVLQKDPRAVVHAR
jgi:hypothetical protein